MKDGPYKISVYLNAEELRQFKLWVKARGLTESMYIREMLGFDVRPRGAPKGPRKKKAEQVKAAKARPDVKEKGSRKSAVKSKAPLLPFLD